MTGKQGLVAVGRDARSRLVLLALAVAAALLLSAPAPAQAANGSIAGTVTSAASSAPLEGVGVCARSTSGYFGSCVGTDSGGQYSIGGLQPGSYEVQFLPHGLDYAPQFYEGQPTRSSADPVQVTSGATTSSVDAQLVAGGHISGTVTVAGSGDPLEGVEVCATEVEGEAGRYCAKSAAGGQYTIEGLGAGSFRVAFYPGSGEVEAGIFGTRNYIPQYWDGRGSASEADQVAVAAGATTSGIDAAMEEGGIVSGTVTDAASHATLESVEVCALERGRGGSNRCASTGADGRYAIAGLPSGSYKVSFSPGSGDHTHVRQYYAGKATLASADAVAVVAGEKKSGIDAELPDGGEVSGQVSASGGPPLEGVGVCAEPVDRELGTYRCGSTGPSGEYAIGGLAGGKYVIRFNGGPDHISQYYDGKASFSEAERVPVADGGKVSGIDATLTPAGKIAGHVTEVGTGNNVAGIEVCAVSPGAPLVPSGDCADTDAGGEYTIGGLAGGSYEVHFRPAHSNEYLPQYYDGKGGGYEADVVTVTPGSTTGSIDAAMQPGGRITGTVTAASDHSPLRGIMACLTKVGSAGANCVATSAAGTYAFGGLASGSYKVEFTTQASAGNYVTQFYSGKATRKAGDPITVTAGKTTPGIDAEMRAGGIIAGVVTDAATGDPIEGIWACVAGRRTFLNTGCAQSNSAGEYEIQALATGSYKVRFEPSSKAAAYLPQYFPGDESEAEAEAVSVTAGETTGGVDAAMIEGGSISGTVTDAGSGEGAALVEACARKPVSNEVAACDQTDSEGHYKIIGLAAGRYAVRFAPGHNLGGEEGSPNYNYVTQFYSGKATLAEADPVKVSDGATTSHVDVAMHEGGKISGRVTAASSGAPIDARVCVHPEGEEEEGEHCASADREGVYTVEGLAAGTYAVSFAEASNPFVVGNYLSQSLSEVTVAAGATHEDVNAALPTGGRITGHVSDASTGKNIGGVEVCALEPTGAEHSLSCGTTDSLGDYTIQKLSTGTYKVEFSDVRYLSEEEPLSGGEGLTAEEIYIRQYWSAAATPAAARAVHVTAGDVTASIDASLVPSGDSEAGGSESPGGGGGAEGAAGPGATSVGGPAVEAAVPAGPSLARRVPRHLKCRRGFARKKVKGRVRCVRRRHHRHHRHHRRRKHRRHRRGARGPSR